MTSSADGNRVVVVAVDASDNAKEAFYWYLNEIYRDRDLVVVCHIPELSDSSLPTLSLKHGITLPVEEWQRACREHLDKVKQLEDFYGNELSLKKIKHKLRSEQSKHAGQGIVAVAEAEKASFIVVGTRGLDVVRRTLLGSVSDYIIHHSKVPVVVCPKS